AFSIFNHAPPLGRSLRCSATMASHSVPYRARHNPSSPVAKLDGELVEIFEAVAYDTKLVPEDAILYNDYYFSDLEVPDLPFRCRSEYKAEPTSPIPEAL